MPYDMRSGAGGGGGGGGGPGGSAVSVSTQADIAPMTTSYESDDENVGRRRQKSSDDHKDRRTNMYSKQEFREQYCINNKQLDLLELEKSKKERFLGCLSQYHIESPCSRSNRSSFLSVCVRRRVPSDENLNTDYAPIQRYPSRFGPPTATPPELYAYDNELECSYFRRRPRSVCSQPDPKRYTWMPEDEEFTRMEWPSSVMEDNQGWPQNYTMDQINSITRGGSLPRSSIIPCPAHTPLPPPPPPPAPPLTLPPHRTKHVSFARSHTLTTFDDSAMPATLGGGAIGGSGRFRRDCTERLLDGRPIKQPDQLGYPAMIQPPFPPHVFFPPAPVHYPPPPALTAHPQFPLAPLPQPAPRTLPPEPTSSKVVLDSIKKGAMRTQATQTEVCLGRKPLPPNYLSLSPRTIKRVKMVAAGVQTNGFTAPRRLTKSFSEVGGERLVGRDQQDICNIIAEGYLNDHEKLQRTQSEEPPRSPRSPSALSSPVLQRGDSDDISEYSPVKSIASFDKSSEMSILQRQAQEYFHQNFQFIHESDRDDTVDDEIQDIEKLEQSLALNRKNLEYLQQKIAEQTKGERAVRSILSKTISDSSQKTVSLHQMSKNSTFQSELSTETSATTTDDSEKNEKEIIIDFEPRPDEEAIGVSKRINKRLLQKTLSEGEILLDVRKCEIQQCSVERVRDAPLVMSTSQENMASDDKDRESRYKHYITQNYAQTPIQDEGIFPLETNGSFSSSDGNAPYEDFHEKYISYKHDAFRKRSISLEEPNALEDNYENHVENGTAKSSPTSPCAVEVDDYDTSKLGAGSCRGGLALLEITSPFASSESLTVDPSRDHSDGIWNESQATVLQVDSGTDNGTVISSSDLSSLAASPGALALLTPTSRRKQLLILQHQQRSSMDTDALDEEFDFSQSQSPTSPRMKLDAPIGANISSRTSLSPPAIVSLNQPPMSKQLIISKNGSPVGVPKINHTPAINITHPSLDLNDVPIKRTPSIINKKRERALSPSRRKDLTRKVPQKTEPNGTIASKILESPADANKTINGETNLARTDSGKTNTTDVSESTTTTDDYVTANSDSSKKSGSKAPNQNPENNKAQDGSSFESASSLYSLTRTENMSEDLIVPSFSPPLNINEDLIVPSFSPAQNQITEKPTKPGVEVIQVKAEIVQRPTQARRDKTEQNKAIVGNSSKFKETMEQASGKSSSSGSYSLTGSTPNIVNETNKVKNDEKNEIKVNRQSSEVKPIRSPIPSPTDELEQTVPTMKESISDDERSGHYSSSGYYESPVEDDDDDGGLTYKHSQKYRSSSRPWTTDEKRRKKKAFTLEFSKSYDDSVSTSQDDFSRKSTKEGDVVSPYKQEKIAQKKYVKSPADEKNIKANKTFKVHYSEKSKSVHSSPRDQVDIEKLIKEKDTENKRQNERERHVKRTKLKTKSPLQSKIGDNGMPGHSRAHFENQRRGEGMVPNTKLHLNIPTSDDSSEQYKKNGVGGNGNISPRKYRRLRDSPRRKSGAGGSIAKSPTSTTPYSGHRSRRKSGSNESISLPGSLPRRKPSIPIAAGLSSLEAEDIETSRTLASAGSRLTPLRYIRSPTMSPRHHRKQEKDNKCAKAASAESLRSVSPGSDSVFYSEQADVSIVDVEGESKAHCLHCGKEVHIVTASHDHDDIITSASTTHTHESFTESTPDIVPAPAGFADSPGNGGGSSGGGSGTSKKSASGARLYKKLDKRYRSEDKSRHHHRHRQDVRAKSEERGKEEYAATEHHEPRIARSAGTSLDKLGGSSGSVDPDEVEEASGSSADGAASGQRAGAERGVYAAPWWCGNWILVPSQDDVLWARVPPADNVSADSSEHSRSEEATESETEFSKKYVALTHRLVHRRACIHMYKRQAESGFVEDLYSDPNGYLRKRLEEIFKLMLMLWVRQCQANKMVAAEPSESDKTVVVRRGNEEFGFRIHGSKPVVVSAIEPDTPAETSGLEVGDIVIAVNGINVLDKSHSEVVKIAHAGSEILELEVARTCEAVASLAHEGGAAALFSGYLWRAAPAPAPAPARGAQHLRWTRRWFVLKRDNCLYYYKTDSSVHPVGALMLINYQLQEEDAGKTHGFRLQRGGGARLQLAADSAEASARWRAVLAHAIDASSQRDGWLEVSMRNMQLPPSSVPRPDCFGYLLKLDSKWKSWSKRYCVLKDACLYFYNDGSSKSAFGMACLHGYRVQQCSPGGRKFAFEVMPAEPKQRHFYFHTESEMDKKRWMAALEYSIDRWMKAG